MLGNSCLRESRWDTVDLTPELDEIGKSETCAKCEHVLSRSSVNYGFDVVASIGGHDEWDGNIATARNAKVETAIRIL